MKSPYGRGSVVPQERLSMPSTLWIAFAALILHAIGCLSIWKFLAGMEHNLDITVVRWLLTSAIASVCLIPCAIAPSRMFQWIARIGACVIAVPWIPVCLIGSLFAAIGVTGGPEAGKFQVWQAYVLLGLNTPLATLVAAAISFNVPTTTVWFRSRQHACSLNPPFISVD